MKTYEQRTADISAKIKRKQRTRRAVLSGSISCLVLALALVLFIPYNTNPPSVAKYADSPYYDLIRKINVATFDEPDYVNNFDFLVNNIPTALKNATGDAMEGGDMDLNSAVGVYQEVTDNQVAGVIEADLFKRSDQYIYYLRGNCVNIYSLAQEDSALVGTYVLETALQPEEGYLAYIEDAQLYLSQDCTTLTVVAEAYFKDLHTCTVLLNLDVTDPANITETGSVYLTGSLLSSRLTDGKLLLMSKFRVASSYDFDDPSTYLPQVGTRDAMQLLPVEDIFSPDTLSNTNYTVICALDPTDLTIFDTVAFLSYSDEVYVSEENIYATRNYEYCEGNTTADRVEISCVHYAGESLSYTGSIDLEGSVKDQYSLDEYEGILRVVTSVDTTETGANGESASATMTRSASLYCVDIQDFSVVASVECFAPYGERAESVRFNADKCYVCTAIVVEMTDPVFFFDLSDLENIIYTDTGTIDGYSSSLVDLGEGYLLGIGYNAMGEMKLEIYEQADDKVVSVCAYERSADFSTDYKSYFIDRENDLIGLGIYDWEYGTRYLLLHFDGYELKVIHYEELSGNVFDMRAAMADGWLYILADDLYTAEIW